MLSDVLKCDSFREWLASFDYADAVIGKIGMHARNFILRHVAGHAILGVVRASGMRHFLASTCMRRIAVASKTSLIVRRRIAHQRLVRIVTSHACKASIPVIAPTPAVLQAIWREA